MNDKKRIDNMKKFGETDLQQLLDQTKLHVVVDMGLAFSAMMRLFKKHSKNMLHTKIYAELQKFFDAKTPDEFGKIHSELCEWGTREISLAKRNGNDIKNGKKASYGQIAKTLDVVLKVVIYYSHFPDCMRAQRLSEWLNVAMDTKMMAHVRREYLKNQDVQSWPKKVDDVCDKETYDLVQETVCRYMKDRHLDKLLPSQFEDILWAKVNKKPWFLTKLSHEI
jgi:hypothetical protein